jgi:hypothetical protein
VCVTSTQELCDNVQVGDGALSRHEMHFHGVEPDDVGLTEVWRSLYRQEGSKHG